MKISARLSLPAIALLLLLAPARAQQLPAPGAMQLDPRIPIEDARDLGKAAIEEIMAQFTAAKGGQGLTSFVILPLRRDIDAGYFTTQLENAFTQTARSAGQKLYTRNDPAVSQILAQTEWSSAFEDVLDAKTKQELGKIVDAQAVIWPRVDLTIADDGTITARANIQIYERETFQLHWGGEAKRVAVSWQQRLFRWSGAILIALGGLVILLWFIFAIRRARRPR